MVPVSTIIAAVVSVLGGYGGRGVIDWLTTRRKTHVDALKSALETISIATDEIRELREELRDAHKQIRELKEEVHCLRAELAQRGTT